MKVFRRILISSFYYFVTASALPALSHEFPDVLDHFGNSVQYCKSYILISENAQNSSYGYIVPKTGAFSSYKYLRKSNFQSDALSGAIQVEPKDSSNCGDNVKLNELFYLKFYGEAEKKYLKSDAFEDFPYLDNKAGKYEDGHLWFLFSFIKLERSKNYALSNSYYYLKCGNNSWCKNFSDLNESLNLGLIPINKAKFEKASADK